jgi:hypothetical protein
MRCEYNIPTSCTIRNQRKRHDKSLFKLRVKSTYKMCHIITQLMTFNSMDEKDNIQLMTFNEVDTMIY